MEENKNNIFLAKENIKALIIACITFFKQAAQYISKYNKELFGGNIDPYYLFGIAFFIDAVRNNRKKDLIIFGIMVIAVIIYAIIQIIFIPEITVLRLIINVVKIYLCFACMLFVKNNYDKINYKKIIYIFSILNAIFIIIACTIGKDSSVFWRFNDTVNVYSETRLSLFFLEPSELGYHVAIVLIFTLYYLLKCEQKKERIYLIGCLACNIVTLILAKPMGAICILAVSFGLMLVIDFFKTESRKKKIFYLGILIIAFIILIIMILTGNEIILRVINTINGVDQSNSYRVNVTYNVFTKSIKDFNFIGCGFGNLNTEHFMSNYDELVTVVVNSFIYFIIETGIFGIVSVILLIIKLIERCIQSKTSLKWGLLCFVIIYQFFGSHFTNGITWAIYGIILSEFQSRKEKLNE